ncbi:MAG: tRNA 2-selenouridine(34) synthase MnmH [Planctomycetota bacterium]
MRSTLSSRAGRVAVPTLRPREALEHPGATLVDLRSPAEFALDHVPGATNVPLFDDVERALVGTLYRQASPDRAFEEGRVIARTKIARFVGEVIGAVGADLDTADLEGRLEEFTARGIDHLESSIACEPATLLHRDPVIFHCWRGGLRSRSVVAFLRGLGLERAHMIEGGYKAYRTEVASQIAAWRPPPIVLVCGLTGVGKTLVLRELERLRPGWTLDLEGLAGHRSSLLGMVGLEPRSQKAFESALASRIRRGFEDRLVVEGESRKVGDVILPSGIWRAMAGGVAVELTAPIERRVQVLEADYLASERSREQLFRQLPLVQQRMDLPADAPSLASLLESGRVDELVRLLLSRYYDPLYRRSEKGRRYATSIDASDPARAAEEIAAWIENAPRAVAPPEPRS